MVFRQGHGHRKSGLLRIDCRETTERDLRVAQKQLLKHVQEHLDLLRASIPAASKAPWNREDLVQFCSLPSRKCSQASRVLIST